MIFAGLVAVLVIGLLLLGVVSAARPKHQRRRGGCPRGRVSRVNVRDGWTNVEAVAATGPGGLKQALLDADKLFDHALRDQGLRGETMGERLKNARSRFRDHGSYDAVWRAHKLRNALAHEVGFDLVPSQAHEALGDFKRGLQQLGAL